MADEPFDPSKLILPESKPAPNPWPQHGHEVMKVQGTRVTLCTIQPGPDEPAWAISAHIMFEHDDVWTLEFRLGTTERMAIDMVTKEIQARAELHALAGRRAEKSDPLNFGEAIRRLVDEATSTCISLDDEFDLSDLREAVDWVEEYLNASAKDLIPPEEKLDGG